MPSYSWHVSSRVRSVLCVAAALLLFLAGITHSHAGAAESSGGTNSDWPMPRHDRSRSSVTDAPLAAPLALLWRYEPDQPPAPAWPEPGKNLNRTDFDYAPHPIVAGGKLFWASSADDTLRAHDAATGAFLWKFTAGGPLRFAPQVADGLLYLPCDDGRLYCLTPETGQLLWSFKGGPREEMILGNGRMISRWPLRTGVLVDEGVAYFAAGMWPAEGVYLWALDAGTGKPIWCNDTAGAGDVRVVGHVIEPSLSGVTPQGLIAASADKLVVPMGRGAPATFDRATGRLVQFHPGDTNGFGGTWLTLDGEMCFAYAASFYSGLAINGVPLDTMKIAPGPQVLKPLQMAGFGMPNPGSFVNALQYTQYDSKVCAIIKDNRLTARKAYGLIRAGGTLVLGYDGSVAAEGTQSKPAATIRLALAGNALAIHASIVDRKVTRDAEKPWKGSCFELFAAGPGTRSPASQPKAGAINLPASGIAQLMFIPALGDAPALAFRPGKEKPQPATAVRVVTTPTPDGYNLAAMVPLEALGLPSDANEIDLEFQVTGVSDSGKTNRDTLFGSPLAYQNREKYRTFRVMEGSAGKGADDDRGAATAPSPIRGEGGRYSGRMRGETSDDQSGDELAKSSGDKTSASPEVHRPSDAHPSPQPSPLRGEGARQDLAATKSLALPRLAGITNLDALPAALAKLPPHEIRVAEQRELWRAPVRGKAYEMAVADGRLYVVTDAGQISCFAPAASGATGSPPPRILAAKPTRDTTPRTEPPPPIAENLLRQIHDARLEAGYILVLGTPESLNLVRALAERSPLQIILAMTDAKAAAAARDYFLSDTGYYGTRVHVLHVASFDALPFPRWFASVVYAAGNTRPGRAALAECYRVLRPAGGLMIAADVSASNAATALTQAGVPANEIRPARADTGAAVVRGKLAGVLDWNSKETNDALVRWPLRPIWFGGTGPAKTHNRKYQGPTLATANGRFIENGQTHVTSVDAYNGAEWWSVPKPVESVGGHFGSSINADDRFAYFLLAPHANKGEKQKPWGCIALDAATGKQQAIYAPAWQAPPSLAIEKSVAWKIAPIPFGDAAGNPKLNQGDEAGLGAAAAAGAGKVTVTRDADGLTVTLAAAPAAPATRAEWLVGFDLRPPGERLGVCQGACWTYRINVQTSDAGATRLCEPDAGEGHPRLAVSAANDRGATSITIRLAWADIPALKGKPPASLGFASVVDYFKGPTVDLPIARGSNLENRFQQDVAAAVNAGWPNLVLDPAEAKELAVRPKILAGGLAGVEGDGADLGEPLPTKLWQMQNRITPGFAAASGLRTHPLTGMKVEKVWIAGDGCSAHSHAGAGVLSRAANAAFYDFLDDSGQRSFGGVRQSCGSSVMAAQGVWYMANGGSGCECTYAFLSQVALAPADQRLNEDWAQFAEWRADTLVRQAALNFGAPGDRRDEAGTLWLGVPRGRSHKAATYDALGRWGPYNGVWQQQSPSVLPVDLAIETFPEGGPWRVSADRVKIDGTDKPWLYASQVRGIRKATLKLDCLPTLAARAAGGAVTVDGKLDEPAWKDRPQVKLAVSQSNVAFAFDDENLYVAATRETAFDRRGDPRKWNAGDAWELFLTDAAEQKVIHLRTSIANARQTALASGPFPTPETSGVTLAWQSAAKAVDGESFVAEFAIPWSTLTQAGVDKSTLRVNALVSDHPLVGEAIVRLGGYGRARCQGFVPLGLGVDPPRPARRFTLRLHFAELDDVPAGKRVFDVRVQGKPALEKFDVVAAAGGPRRAAMREIKGVEAGEALTLKFLPREGEAGLQPFLSAMELEEETAGR